ncbi:MAG: peptidylprolyl isomerase [Kiritimatiellales bacterium]
MCKVIEKSKKAGLIAVAAALALVSTGCSKEVQDVEEIDLTSADLFTNPLQPNPLAAAPDDVMVTVNGKPITHGEISQNVQLQMMQMSRQVPQQQLMQMAGQIYENVRDTLVANILLEETAKATGVTAGDDELDAEITRIKDNAPEESKLEDILAENNINYDDWKENLRDQMIVRKLVEQVTSTAPEATAVDVASFYEKNQEAFQSPEAVTASHILIGFKPEDTEETKAEKKKQAEAILEKLNAGADFATLASENSDCPSNQRGGSLGTFGRGQMVPEFEAAAFGAKDGEVTEVVETQFGYHIIKVDEYRPAGVRTLAEVKDQLQNYLTSQNKQKALLDYVDELRSKADIEYKTPDFDAAAAAAESTESSE